MLMRSQDSVAMRYHAALKLVIKRAILVLDALGDSEMRFQNQGQVWARAIDDAAMAYGWTAATVRIIPTSREIAQAEIVADWLAWLGRTHGKDHVPRLVSWAHDQPIWRMAERESCSERTIHNRIDRSVAHILREFGDLDIALPEINEAPEKQGAAGFFVERPMASPSGGEISQHGKCWIDGVGFMRHGRRLNDGRNRVTDRMMGR